MTSLMEISWPVDRAAEALRALAKRADIPSRSAPLAPTRHSKLGLDRDASVAWIESNTGFLGLESRHNLVLYGGMAELAARQPVLLLLESETGLRLVAVIGLGRGRLILIDPQLTEIRTTVDALRTAIAASLECHLEETFTPILREAGVGDRVRARALAHLLEERFGGVAIAEAWTLGLPVSAGLWAHIRRAGMPGMAAAFVAACAVEAGLWILSWAVVGQWALGERDGNRWLAAWALLLLALIPAHLAAMWQQGKLAVSGGSLVMRFLLEGSFRLKPEEVKCEGAGQLLGRVLDAEALQSFALTGGLAAAVSAVQLAAACSILGMGLGAGFAQFLLLAWATIAGVMACAYYRRLRKWTASRLDVTSELVENMLGHRTRLAQGPVLRESTENEIFEGCETLEQYAEESRRTDRLNVLCTSLLPRGWLIAGLAALAPGMAAGTVSPGGLAAAIGAILLGYNALRGLTASLSALMSAAIAAERTRGFLAAAHQPEPAGDPGSLIDALSDDGGRLLEMRHVSYRYAGRAADAVRQASVRIANGDRVLLEGPPGSGKSTWVALAGGIRQPDSGLLLLRGIDRKTLGDRNWRRLVAASRQFHENHIFCSSLACNLLMGREWPARPQDLAEAEAICRELGLGPLLDTMPSGLMQMVGDSGWQLSNGEKSRVYLARTLLQRADVIVLDESLGALDPETAEQVMVASCAVRRR